jgi:hypothetical protein
MAISVSLPRPAAAIDCKLSWTVNIQQRSASDTLTLLDLSDEKIIVVGLFEAGGSKEVKAIFTDHHASMF